MINNKKTIYYLTMIPVAIIVGLIIWIFTIIFEGGKPNLTVDPLPEFMAKKQTFTLKAWDTGRGLRAVKVSYAGGGKEGTILDETFSFDGFLNGKGVHSYEKEFVIDTKGLQLTQDTINLTVQAWDYSKKNGGDGNTAVITHTMTLDTIPPAISPLSQMHNINQGGTGLVVYKTSSDTSESGIYVGDVFFKGYPANDAGDSETHVVYFAIPYNITKSPAIKLWAKDKAGNTATSTFNYLVKRINFKTDDINLSDSFLQKVSSYFSEDIDTSSSDIDNYLKINKEFRKKDNALIYDLMKDVSPDKLWDGSWLCLRNAENKARYADHRRYLYKGKLVDEQDHLGIDLASVANDPIAAENNGKILFAEKNGIYGNMVVIDHGQGIASLYGHLNDILVTKGQEVKKGDIIGHTGQTGLAGGDHLHVSILVQGVFVNPIEWWDDHWIKDNVTSKLELIKNQQ